MKPLLFSLLLPIFFYAQIPETDIWLFKIDKKDGKYSYSNPLNITNRPGYDNQPIFLNDDKSILYVCIDSTKQADIYKYTISKKTSVNITSTNISEYSPTLLPNGLGFSCVVVNEDSSQHVKLYELNGLSPKISPQFGDSVGYHTWLNNDTLLYYKLTNPHSLRILDIKTSKELWLCNNPARSFKRTGVSSQFIYAIKDSVKMEFRIFDPALRQSTIYTTYPSTNEDFIFHSELGLIKSENADLMRYNEQTKGWETLFSFASLGIKKITRFNFDSKTKQLAIVSNL